MKLSGWDWIVFAAILGLTLAAVLWGNRQKRGSLLDMLVMGRALSLPMFVATLVATWYGGIFGVTRIAFEKGIYNFVTQGLFWYLAYVIFALFLVDKIAPFRALTLPDLVGKMFGPKAAKLSAVFNFFNVLPIAYIISLGLFLQMLFGGELWGMMALGTALVVLYSMGGGLRAVVFSDLVQFLVMCLGVFLILAMSVATYGGPSFLVDNLPPTHFSPTGGMGLGTTLAWGLIALSTLVDPNFYQRCFAARSSKVAKRGILISTIVWFCFDICTTFGAMYARAALPNADPGSAYLNYAMGILPNGLRGLMLAGVLATILSTLDSYLFLAGASAGYDLAPAHLKGKAKTHRLGVLFSAILALGLACAFDGNIKNVWKTLGSYSASCLLLPILHGHIFPGRIRDGQFVTACCLGALAVSLGKLFAMGIDELYIGILATGASLALFHWKTRHT